MMPIEVTIKNNDKNWGFSGLFEVAKHLSSKGDSFVQDHGKMTNGLTMSFSEDASDDFIYDVQDEWNLNFYLD